MHVLYLFIFLKCTGVCKLYSPTYRGNVMFRMLCTVLTLFYSRCCRFLRNM